MLSGTSMSDATVLLTTAEQGDAGAADELLKLVYDALRRLAAFKMAQHPPGQTLQPTALVHEVWLKLVGSGNPRFKNRAHFFSAAAEKKCARFLKRGLPEPTSFSHTSCTSAVGWSVWPGGCCAILNAARRRSSSYTSLSTPPAAPAPP